jgi:hypothetical protein
VSGYIKNVKVKVTVDGTEHTFTLRTLRYEQQTLIVSAGENEQPAKRRRTQTATAIGLLPSSILSIEPPITDAEGVVLTAEELCDASYFTAAMSEVALEWVGRSQPANPPSPGESSAGDSPGSPSTTSIPSTEA